MQPSQTAHHGHPAPATLADLAALDAALARDHAAHQRAQRRLQARLEIQEHLGYAREVLGHDAGKQARLRAITRIEAAMALVGEALL